MLGNNEAFGDQYKKTNTNKSCSQNGNKTYGINFKEGIVVNRDINDAVDSEIMVIDKKGSHDKACNGDDAGDIENKSYTISNSLTNELLTTHNGNNSNTGDNNEFVENCDKDEVADQDERNILIFYEYQHEPVTLTENDNNNNN